MTLASRPLSSTAGALALDAPSAQDPSDSSTQWNAHLDIRFETRTSSGQSNDAAVGESNSESNSANTFLAYRRHVGPLRIQKPLYPEGPGICHAVIVHPPGGIAGGDVLKIDVDVGAGSHAVMTTPGATKWYKSNQRSSRQSVTLHVHDGARLDWLPQNNLFFNASHAELDLHLTVAPSASAIGWETAQLGRQAAGEHWQLGDLRSRTVLARPDGQLLWTEQAVLSADDPIRHALQGLGGWAVFGTLWAVSADLQAGTAGATSAAPMDADSALIEQLTALLGFDDNIRGGVTCLPGGVILIRAVARQIETLQALFIECWGLLRPALHGVPAQVLRIWST
jgi:urease accessory protein